MESIIYLSKMGTNKETGNQEVFPLNLEIQDVICAYKDDSGVYITMKNGKTHKVIEKFRDVKNTLIAYRRKRSAKI